MVWNLGQDLEMIGFTGVAKMRSEVREMLQLFLLAPASILFDDDFVRGGGHFKKKLDEASW